MGLFKDKLPVKSVGAQNITPSIELNGIKMVMDETGSWISNGGDGQVPAHMVQHLTDMKHRLAGADQHILMLENRVRQLEAELNNRGVTPQQPQLLEDTKLKSANLDLKLIVSQKDVEIAKLVSDVRELEYRNRVLLAMCTISEGDYMSLCYEAGVDPRLTGNFTSYTNIRSRSPSPNKHRPSKSSPNVSPKLNKR